MGNKELTSADIFAMFDRTNQLIDKLSADADRRSAEADRRSAELDRKFEETKHGFEETKHGFEETKRGFEETKRGFEETKQLFDKLDIKFDDTKQLFDKLGIKAENMNTKLEGISKSNGLFAEEYFYNTLEQKIDKSLEQKMEFAGIHFDNICYGDALHATKGAPNGGTVRDQFDIIMRNGNSVAIIEVKYKAESKSVKELATRKVKNFRILFPEYEKYDIYLGLASLSFSKHVVNKAREYGVVLLKQAGDALEHKADWTVKAY